VVLDIFNMQLLLINLISSLIGKFNQKSNFQPRLAWTRPHKRR